MMGDDKEIKNLKESLKECESKPTRKCASKSESL